MLEKVVTEMEKVYLDFNASTPIAPEVVEAMTPLLMDYYGNPSALHWAGKPVKELLHKARSQVAKLIDCKENEIIFTSGGSEANNLALKGICFHNFDKGNHIITSRIEHPAIMNPCRFLERLGAKVTYVGVDEYGRVAPEEIENAITKETILISIMHANNEPGTLQPIKEIGDLLKEHQALFHTDAVQAYGLVSIDVSETNIDLLSVSAHKINGPKGIGFLYVRNNVLLSPLIFGGEQERKRRAGTENVASIAGFQEAVKVAQSERDQKVKKYQQIMIEDLKTHEIDFSVNGSLENSLPHVLNLSFPGTNVEAMLVNLDLVGIAASSGSACTAGSIDPSHVLVAMFGSHSEKLRNSIRFSFGLYNTTEQIHKVASATAEIVKRLTNK